MSKDDLHGRRGFLARGLTAGQPPAFLAAVTALARAADGVG